ncbi:MAG: hypothetical protein COY69_01420 [Candidatus Magasanikbacteria bacterium CG_4_10_14_0_8_um_filter_32_14]|uniref:Uncharacterized protein n=2 Tax=Candidatus Magasanikiibacteriota TaxID=1752731 RepID=A0A2M7R9N6_9BACT|nr:MAG: hypothetical protein AUJ23_00205 [Candidatus Magasanikbacteria bacterium CG1_02_32_51]PIY93475.1 MAG: hypothetical protein COY69_01420 [Candidatus Magasanikbacteria bacterium CG_4_10_14_0_8_um_filter_32_14]
MKKKDKLFFIKKKISICLLIFVFNFVFIFSIAKTVFAKVNSPKLANYYLNWDMTEVQAKELSKWDLVVLDMEVQARHPDLLQKMRVWNPNIILLVYITPQEIVKDASSSYSIMRKKLVSGIYDDWYLKDNNGNKLSWWPTTYLLNITDDAPVHNGERLNDYMARFVTQNLLSSGFWDGVFYDNSWDNITWFAGKNIDLSNYGKVSVDLDNKWREGLISIYNQTRNLYGKSVILLGNNHNALYLQELNGKLLENFSSTDWSSIMNTLKKLVQEHTSPQISFVNSNTYNTGVQNYQDMRFGLASSLLENTYFSYDNGDTNHGQTWWYDEYNINLGQPIAEASSQNSYNTYKPDVWERNFENGLAIVNSTNSKQKINLDGEYEKIHGIQDSKINDGSIVNQVNVASNDGLILLKTFDKLNDILFTNGSFLRFFRPDGMRVRNGFFSFDDQYKGGDKIAYIDLDKNGKRDLLVAHENRIDTWRDDGQKYFKIYPFATGYMGKMNVAIGDLQGYGLSEIFVAPSKGISQPIKIYSIYGEEKRTDFYPFGRDYTGGYSLTIGDVDGDGFQELVIGRGGDKTQVYIYDKDLKLKNEFTPFESNFKSGVNVATGDLDGNKIDEIIVGRGDDGKPEIKVFDISGKLLFQSFTAYNSFVNSGIDVKALDVDFDGKDDIVTMSEGAF